MGWALALGAALLGCSEAEPDPREEETRALMREIFAAVRVALPASADPERFRAAESRAEIGAALDALARRAALLEAHAAAGDESSGFLARSVARDARDLQRAWQRDRPDRAAFLLRQIVENCVVCHSRLPSPEDASVSEGFVDEEALRGLAPESRATLQMATRRFDDALETLEGLFASGEHPALLLGPLTDYLVVSLRVKGDFARPLPVLRRFAARDDLWARLRGDVEGWIEALPRLAARSRGRDDLATARTILQEARGRAVLPDDRSILVDEIVASAVLERFIARHPAPDRDLAEAFFLLGLVEARIGRNYWVSPAPFLLERAIRLAPAEPFARDAYGILEEETLRALEGSDDEVIPEPQATRLAELRALLGER